MTGVGAWMGYAVAAAYYFSAEAGYGTEFCEYSGIGSDVISALHSMVDFSSAE